MRRLTYALIVSLSVCFPTTGNALSDTEKNLDINALVDFFNTVVFGSEFRSIEAAQNIRKWKRPLRVVAREYTEIVSSTSTGRKIRRMEAVDVAPAHLELVQKHLNTLAGLTGLKTQDAGKTNWPANFIINFVPPLQLANPDLADVENSILRRLAGQGGCYFILWPSDDGNSLQKAVIVVNKARAPERIDHCVLEEMTQSLGLPNDAHPPWPSIFANSGSILSLSPVDRIMIETLYDKRLQPGTPKKEALITARQIITEQLKK